MSEDEAIKVIKKRTEKLLEEVKIEKEEELEDEPRIAYLMQQISANKIILDLYQKEKEKNKRQAEHIQGINKRNENLRTHLKLLQAHRLKKYMMDNYISKDTIRELIKNKSYIDTYSFETIAVKDILELLEENKK